MVLEITLILPYFSHGSTSRLFFLYKVVVLKYIEKKTWSKHKIKTKKYCTSDQLKSNLLNKKIDKKINTKDGKDKKH